MSARRVDQGMAAAAVGILPAEVTKEVRTRYRQLPVMVRAAGLAATYAFLVAKSDDKELGRAYRSVADGIRAHLDRRSLLTGVSDNLKVVGALATLDAADYARASREIEALAGWLSRLADAA